MTTLGTRLLTWLRGERVGSDAYGNSYYRLKRDTPTGRGGGRFRIGVKRHGAGHFCRCRVHHGQAHSVAVVHIHTLGRRVVEERVGIDAVRFDGPFPEPIDFSLLPGRPGKCSATEQMDMQMGYCLASVPPIVNDYPEPGL